MFVGEERSLASFDPHLHALWYGDYGKHNIGPFAKYLDDKGWEAEMAAFKLTEEDKRFLEQHRNDPPLTEKN